MPEAEFTLVSCTATDCARGTSTPPMPESLLSELSKDALFTIRAVPTKGLGAFATRAIAKGTLILAEKPLLTIQDAFYFQADVEEAFNTITDEQKKVYMSLASAHGQDPNRWPHEPHPFLENGEKRRILEQHAARVAKEKSVLSVCMTNAMQAGTGSAVFQIASRFNHSCVPNACFAWDERKGMEMIHAVKDIPEGEEITLSYCDPFYDISMRKWELSHYGFTCLCPACTDLDNPRSFGHASRDRRWKLREWDDELQFATADAERVRIRMNMVAAMREEGLCTPGLGGALKEIAGVCQRAGDLRFAVKAAEMAVGAYETCLGKENERTEGAVKAARAFRKELEGH